MIITLYKNYSESNRIGKALGDPIQFTSCQLKENTSVLDPVILLETENPTAYNYMRIPQFSRYYFITDMKSIRNNLWEISGTVDVLETYKVDIRALSVILSDSQSEGSNYLSGEQWKSLVKSKTDIVKFSNGLNDTGEYILITAGG